MSGAEHTNTDLAQFSGINPVVESSDSKGLSNFQGGGEGVPVKSSCFNSLGERIPDYSNSVAVGEGGYGGDLGNWDVGGCFGEGVNPFSGVGEEFGIVDTSVQGGGLPGMGNNIANGDVALRPDGGNVDAAEQLPTCGNDMVEDGSKGTRSGDEVSAIETTTEVPHSNDCYEDGKDGDKVPNSNDGITGGSLGHQEVENKGFEPEVVGRWDSIYEVAKQAEESAGLIPTSCDIMAHKSGDEHECVKSEAGNPSGGLGNSLKPGIVSVSSTLVDEVAELSSELHTQKDEPHLSIHDEEMEQKGYATSEVKQDNARKVQSEKIRHDTGKQSGGIVEGKPTASDEKVNLNGRRRPALQEAGGQAYIVVFGIPATDPNVKIRPSRNLAMGSASTGKRKPRQPSTASPRGLRPKSQDHPNAPVAVTNFENTQDSSAGRRGRKKREVQGKSGDEFSKIRKRLRYLLHRIAYERNLLDAYSSEGWRGQSIEKLRPEKELQRAKADINRSKLKIRELFHRLDSMSAEGKFPDSLYDSEGLIDSEDIFCAKCGSKDLPAGNDIILCDGNCDRGFHQYCLEPPVKTEEIPPGDEGWFCPACDCKFDCIDLLNDSQGAKLSIQDTWEKIFPEAVEAMSGHQQDDIMGLPSDDSEDNDYNPDGQDLEDNREEGKATSSDESDPDESDSSDFSSASEDLGAVCRDEQYLGLPSDDSEDNDFDPEGPDSTVDDEGSSSSSEFTSASEDLGVTVGNDDASENEGHPSPVEVDKDSDVSLASSGRRLVEKLDYKKLYDETYGNADSDSSDDEEWTDDVATTRRKISAKREVSVSAERNALASVDRPDPSVTPRRRGRPKRDCQVVDGSSVELKKKRQETSSGGKSRKGLSYNRLSETVTQRLYESFNEIQYPDRSTKEKLAGELGLTPLRVDKWFGNARWSLRHHPSRVEASIARVLPGSGTPQIIPPNSADDKVTITEHGSVDMKDVGEGISSLEKSRKRKEADDVLQISQSEASKESETQSLDGIDTSKENTKADPLQTPEALGRGQRKRRKSGAS